MSNTPVQLTTTHYTTAGGAAVGVALWALQTYAFHGSVPGALQVAIPIIVPAACAGIASWWTKQQDRSTTPKPADTGGSDAGGSSKQS